MNRMNYIHRVESYIRKGVNTEHVELKLLFSYNPMAITSFICCDGRLHFILFCLVSPGIIMDLSWLAELCFNLFLFSIS